MRLSALSPGDQGMGEFADDMAGNLAAEPPARRRRRLLRKGIKRRAGDGGIATIMRLHLLEEARQIGDQPVFLRIVAQHIAFADIGFPGFEHRPQIDIDNIVGFDDPDRRIVAGDGDGVGAGPDDAAVPVLFDAELPRGQIADLVFDLALADPGANQLFPFDGIEKPQRLYLGGFQLGAARIFDKWKQVGHARIGASRPSKINRKINRRIAADENDGCTIGAAAGGSGDAEPPLHHVLARISLPAMPSPSLPKALRATRSPADFSSPAWRPGVSSRFKMAGPGILRDCPTIIRRSA